MKNKINERGYSLIELIAVIALIALILLLFAPKVVGIVGEFSDDRFKYLVMRNAELAAKNYISDNRNESTIVSGVKEQCTKEGAITATTMVNINTLMDENYLEAKKAMQRGSINPEYDYVEVEYNCRTKKFVSYSYIDNPINKINMVLSEVTSNSIKLYYTVDSNNNMEINIANGSCYIASISKEGTYNTESIELKGQITSAYSCSFFELKSDTEYENEVALSIETNEKTIKAIKKDKFKTEKLTAPTYESEIDCSTTSKLINIIYDVTNVDDPQYYFSINDGSSVKVPDDKKIYSCSENYICSEVYDTKNVLSEGRYKIDSSSLVDIGNNSSQRLRSLPIYYSSDFELVASISDNKNIVNTTSAKLTYNDEYKKQYMATNERINTIYTNAFKLNYEEANGQINLGNDTKKCDFSYKIKDVSSNNFHTFDSYKKIVMYLKPDTVYKLSICTNFQNKEVVCTSGFSGKTDVFEDPLFDLENVECQPGRFKITEKNYDNVYGNVQRYIIVKSPTNNSVEFDEGCELFGDDFLCSSVGVLDNGKDYVTVSNTKTFFINIKNPGDVITYISDGINTTEADQKIITYSELSFENNIKINSSLKSSKTNTLTFSNSVTKSSESLNSCKNLKLKCTVVENNIEKEGEYNQNNNECSFNELIHNKSYIYKISANLKRCRYDDIIISGDSLEEGTEEILDPSLNFSNFSIVDDKLKSTLNLTYDSTNITIPTYYVKSNLKIKINENAYLCSNGYNNSCDSTAMTNNTLEKDTWYRVNETSTFDVSNVGGQKLELNTITSDGYNYKQVNFTKIVPFIKLSDKNTNNMTAKTGSVTLESGKYLIMLWGGKGGTGCSNKNTGSCYGEAIGGNSGFVYGESSLTGSKQIYYSLGGNGLNYDSSIKDSYGRIQGGANGGGFSGSLSTLGSTVVSEGWEGPWYARVYTYHNQYKSSISSETGASGGGYSILYTSSSGYSTTSDFSNGNIWLLSAGGGGAGRFNHDNIRAIGANGTANGGMGGNVKNSSSANINGGTIFSGQNGSTCQSGYTSTNYVGTGGGKDSGGSSSDAEYEYYDNYVKEDGSFMKGGSGNYSTNVNFINQTFTRKVIQFETTLKGGSLGGGGGSGYYGGAGGSSYSNTARCVSNSDTGCVGGGGGGSSFISNQINYNITDNQILNLINITGNPSSTGGGIIIYYLD